MAFRHHGSARYRWSRTSPALPSYGDLRINQANLQLRNEPKNFRIICLLTYIKKFALTITFVMEALK
jgi:hypothetical protein